MIRTRNIIHDYTAECSPIPQNKRRPQMLLSAGGEVFVFVFYAVKVWLPAPISSVFPGRITVAVQPSGTVNVYV